MNGSTVSFAVFMRSPSWISVLAAIKNFCSIWTEARSYGLVADHFDIFQTVRPSPRRISLRRICRPWVKTASTQLPIDGRLCKGKLNNKLDGCLAPSCFEHTPDDFTEGRVFHHCPLALRLSLPFDGHSFHLCLDSGSLERRSSCTLSRPAAVKFPHWVSFCRDDRRLPRFLQGREISTGLSGPWYDRDSSSSTATWPRPPGSLMAPLTRWVEGDGHVLGARCRRTSDYCVSLVTVHVGPTWVSLALGQPASRSTVACKPGHNSPWTLIMDLQPSMERATGHQRAGRRSGASLDTTRPGTRSQKRL